MKYFRILAILIILSSFAFSQTNQWVNFLAESNINCQAIEGNYLWIGADNYLTKLNTLTGEKEIFTTKNSGLPDKRIYSIAIDQLGNKWIGTYGGGLAKFDGQTWNVFTTLNFCLPSNNVQSLAIDQQGNKWIGTNGGGIVKYDGRKWTGYSKSNSGLPDNCVTS
ncbi:MAG: two-component regulator propeller domain-containing protein, partial [Bacteroidota bacterium]|nr:two-component regulator propeller domain-containing protein [Bacteroidota bacterium]